MLSSLPFYMASSEGSTCILQSQSIFLKNGLMKGVAIRDRALYIREQLLSTIFKKWNFHYLYMHLNFETQQNFPEYCLFLMPWTKQ